MGLVFCLCVCGCGKPPQEPEPPKPVTIVTPTEASPPVSVIPLPPPNAAEGSGLRGKWSHTLPGPDGQQRTVILQYVKDQDGRERFEFVQQHWPSKPVFAEQLKSGDETVLHFQMASASDEADVPPRTLRYVLKEDNGTWSGKLFESWTETSYDVVLTKTE
ncbi:MAG: hypothetical protein SH850_22165 [Planctomycetaceae bacterium]|nr:hypothetical protein [Planctomycetaceae bacterium]